MDGVRRLRFDVVVHQRGSGEIAEDSGVSRVPAGFEFLAATERIQAADELEGLAVVQVVDPVIAAQNQILAVPTPGVGLGIFVLDAVARVMVNVLVRDAHDRRAVERIRERNVFGRQDGLCRIAVQYQNGDKHKDTKARRRQKRSDEFPFHDAIIRRRGAENKSASPSSSTDYTDYTDFRPGERSGPASETILRAQRYCVFCASGRGYRLSQFRTRPLGH